jgi:ElaA protein
MTINWTIRTLDELSARELYELIRLRVDVFVVEQNCPYAELDGLDLNAHHVLGHDEEGRLMACARILPPEHGGLPHIGRVVVHPALRGKGLAHELMTNALDALHRIHGSRRSELAAQAHLEAFYAAHGYERTGADYDLDGIPHVDMRRNEGQASA